MSDEEDYTRTTISIPPHVLEAGKARAAQFRLSFSDYLTRLVEEEARAMRSTLTIVAEEPATDYAPAFKRQQPAPKQSVSDLERAAKKANKASAAKQAARKKHAA